MNTPTNLPSDFEGTHKSEPSVHKFEITGRAEEMWPIILKNLLFNILTLSLYRFWGRTNVRRYLWENVRLMGDPFEYTGKGGEMFTGFLIALLTVFLPLGGAVFYAQTLIARGSMALGVALILGVSFIGLWLLNFAVYSSLRYRLSRTRWRGIRGALSGKASAYAWSAYVYNLVLVITIGLARPFVDNKLWGLQINNAQIGSGAFAYKANSERLLNAFIAMIGYSVLGFVSYFITVFIAALTGVTALTVIGAIGGYLLFLWFLAKGIATYEHKKLEHFLDNTSFEGTTLNFQGTRAEMLGVIIWNTIWVVFTLGLALPTAQLRLVNYVFSNLELEGDLDLAKISQSTEVEPSFGEGLAEGFDMGTI